ncbi:MAG TPA: hypothetical protein VHD91_10365 [Gaiellaceae bacterium]|nr:hypothetical protein [Gaiellaceae bacterium]
MSSNFEERLLVELKTVVAAEPAERGHRPRRRLALAAGLAALLAAAATAGVLLSSGAKAAYAVTNDGNGTVTVEIDSLSDAAGLEAALDAQGVNAVVQYLPEGKICKQPWFTPAGRTAGAGGVDQAGTARESDHVEFTISTGDIPAGDTLVISTQTGAGNLTALGIAVAQGTVPPCQVVDAPAGSGPLGGPPTP